MGRRVGAVSGRGWALWAGPGLGSGLRASSRTVERVFQWVLQQQLLFSDPQGPCGGCIAWRYGKVYVRHGHICGSWLVKQSCVYQLTKTKKRAKQ